MVRPIEEIENAIRALSPEDKEHLLHVLLDELDEPPNSEIERAWLEEAQRRSAAADRGTMPSFPVEDVLREIREELRRR